MISEFFQKNVKPLKKKYGGTWVFLHHFRKEMNGIRSNEDLLMKFRGGSEIINVPRFALVCEVPKKSKNLMVLHIPKMQMTERPDSKVISFNSSDDENSLSIEYLGLPEEALKKEKECADAIKNYLFDEQTTEFQTKTMKGVMKEKGFGGTSVQDALRLLIEQDFLERGKIGHYSVKGGKNKQVKL